MVTIAEIVADLERRYAEGEALTSPEVDHICEHIQLSRQQFFEAISAEIARSFDAQKISFEAADAAMNDLWAIALYEDEKVPPLLDAVYLAFDAGEMASPLRSPHDPVETDTRPSIRKIVERLAATQS